MPLDINIYEITGLKASVSAMFGGDELSSTIGFALNLQISTLELNKQYKGYKQCYFIMQG